MKLAFLFFVSLLTPVPLLGVSQAIEAGRRSAHCRVDEQYLTCGRTCAPTCDRVTPCVGNTGRKSVACISGCFCRYGLLRDASGQCMRKMYCSQRSTLNERT